MGRIITTLTTNYLRCKQCGRPLEQYLAPYLEMLLEGSCTTLIALSVPRRLGSHMTDFPHKDLPFNIQDWDFFCSSECANTFTPKRNP